MAAYVPPSSLSSELFPSRDCISNGFSSLQNVLLESRRQNDLPENARDANTVLNVTIHHARDLHNICIYGNQDVYARISLTHCQDAVYSTQPVKAGGKNPVFNQSLQIPAPPPDANLKCEIWMMSCARNYLEDQLLGFALVPLGGLIDKGKRSQDYLLTSTDLFFTPAGTVCLSLLFHSSSGDLLELGVNGKVFQDNTSSVCPTPTSSPVITMEDGYPSLGQSDLSKIEFPDLDVTSENQQLISAYLKLASFDIRESCDGSVLLESGIAPLIHDQNGTTFLEPIASPTEEVDCEMPSSSQEEKCMEVSTNSGLSPHSSFTSLCSNENLSISSKNTLASLATEHHCEPSEALKSGNQDKEKAFLTSHESEGPALIAPLINISMETEVPVVRQAIVDIYIKSMQQFTEKLAEMKLPLDVEAQEFVVSEEKRKETEGAEEGRKMGSKLFYGSRAFY